MAKKELFEPNSKLKGLVVKLGAFAVNRSKPEIGTFKTVIDVLKTSWSLGIFPQGTVKPYGKLEDIKKGFSKFAPQALHPKCTITRGILEKECADIMKDFFKERRI